jgi:hypothetical protein
MVSLRLFLLLWWLVGWWARWWGAQTQRFLAEGVATRALSGLLTALEDRRDDVRKQVYLLPDTAPERDGLARLVDCYEDHVAALVPHRATLTTFEKVCGARITWAGPATTTLSPLCACVRRSLVCVQLYARTLAALQRTEQQLASLGMALDTERQQGAQLRDELDRLRRDHAGAAVARAHAHAHACLRRP